MQTVVGNTRIVLKNGDITKECTDAVVNAANSSLMGLHELKTIDKVST